MLLKGNPPPKMYSYCNIFAIFFAMKLSFIFEFKLVLFTFSLISGDPFLVSLPKSMGRGTIFLKRLSMGKQIFWGEYMGVCCIWGD